MYGIGYISPSVNTLLHKSQNLSTLGKLPPMQSAAGNAFDIDYVPISEIYTDEKSFQNRADKYSEKSVNSIINAVNNGAFNWFAFDPVTLWLNPSDGKYYVLSGHSRTQAFRQLSKQRPQIVVDGLTFDKIPAKIFKGSFNDAQYLALNSNTLGTPETLTERADYYRTQRANTEKSKIKDLKKKALRENNGQLIWDLSYLPANGMTMQSLKAFKVDGQDSMENFVRLATIAQWIGKAFQIYKGLSSAHDQELLKFLLNGGYGSKSGQYFSFSALNDRLEKLYKKNVADEKSVNRNGEYTKPFQIAAYQKSDSDLDEINELKKISDNALKELKASLKNLRDNNADRETIFRVATPYFNGWVNAQYDWWQMLDRVPVKDDSPALFGLGKLPTAQLFDVERIPSQRMMDIADYVASNFDADENPTDAEVRIRMNNIFDWRTLPHPESDGYDLLFHLYDYIKTTPKRRQSPSTLKQKESQIFPKPTQPVKRNTKGERRFQQVKWNRWTRNQVAWGKFIEKVRPLITPENLIADDFSVVIIDNCNNQTKKFSNIAEALDYAFEYGFLRNHSFFIINDKDANVLVSDELDKDKKYITQLSGLMGLGKPTIKFEFEDNAELLAFQESIKNSMPRISEPIEWNSETETFEPGVSGLTVNDKPAAIFNCTESALDTRGYRPTYQILANYDHLVDPSNGRKTLKGYGFESATLDELVNACRYYPQVAALAAHLKDPNGDALQSAFNIWHWLHTNVRYDFDAPGEEEIRTPARAYADRKRGIDCDCLAVLTACLLINQGYQPCFEIVAFNNEPTFSHIYVTLDGAAIDRVLPVFLARPDNITKTQIMEIPVYSLSGIGGCRDTLSGVYSSTLAKIQSGTATGDDNNEFRKTQVLVTLRGVNDAAYQLAALLMPYVVTVADDGTYYFDSSALANLATKLDDDLRQLIANDADPETVKQWIATAAQKIDGAASVQSNGGNDTIVVIINPQGNMTRVIGQMVKASTPTLTATTAAATDQPPAAATSSTPAIMQTSPLPGVPTGGETESDSGDWWKYALAAAAGIGIGAMVGGKKKTNKRR